MKPNTEAGMTEAKPDTEELRVRTQQGQWEHVQAVIDDIVALLETVPGMAAGHIVERLSARWAQEPVLAGLGYAMAKGHVKVIGGYDPMVSVLDQIYFASASLQRKLAEHATRHGLDVLAAAAEVIAAIGLTMRLHGLTADVEHVVETWSTKLERRPR